MRTVDAVMKALDLPYFIVGATARDILLTHVFGLETGHWYRPSSLETFMRDSYPEEFENRWTSHMGTGRNLLGMVSVRGHGTPGPILWLDTVELNAHVEQIPDEEKRALYNLFRSGAAEAIEERVDDIKMRVNIERIASPEG